MRVLVVRAADDARRTAARLAAAGHETLIAPVIEIKPLGAKIPDEDFDALVATSAHAFAGMAAPARIADTPVHVVGARTAEAAERAGFRRIAHVAPNASALAHNLDRSLQSRMRVLYLAGRDRRPELEVMFADRQALCVVETYAAEACAGLSEAARTALAQGSIDAVLHYSRRSTAIFVDVLNKVSLANNVAAVAHIAISPDAAQPLLAAKMKVAIAAQPDEDAMIAELERMRERKRTS